MATTLEMRAELKKARFRKFIYFGAGIGLFCLGVALFITFLVRKPHDIPAVILAVVAAIFGALMINQAMRSRETEDELTAKLEDLEDPEDGNDTGPEPGGGSEASQDGSSESGGSDEP
jgi:hypothetical protein